MTTDKLLGLIILFETLFLLRNSSQMYP